MIDVAKSATGKTMERMSREERKWPLAFRESTFRKSRNRNAIIGTLGAGPKKKKPNMAINVAKAPIMLNWFERIIPRF